MKSNIKHLVLCGLFSALITVGAFVRIPIPPIPITMQLEFALLSGMILGKKYGTGSVLVYIILGLCGLPVFSGGGGLGYILSPTFGYIIGFAFGAFISGMISSAGKLSIGRLYVSSLSGMLTVYFFGVLYYWLINTLYLGNTVAFSKMIFSCFLIFLPADIVLCLLFSYIAYRINISLFRL